MTIIIIMCTYTCILYRYIVFWSHRHEINRKKMNNYTLYRLNTKKPPTTMVPNPIVKVIYVSKKSREVIILSRVDFGGNFSVYEAIFTQCLWICWVPFWEVLCIHKMFTSWGANNQCDTGNETAKCWRLFISICT